MSNAENPGVPPLQSHVGLLIRNRRGSSNNICIDSRLHGRREGSHDPDIEREDQNGNCLYKRHKEKKKKSKGEEGVAAERERNETTEGNPPSLSRSSVTASSSSSPSPACQLETDVESRDHEGCLAKKGFPMACNSRHCCCKNEVYEENEQLSMLGRSKMKEGTETGVCEQVGSEDVGQGEFGASRDEGLDRTSDGKDAGNQVDTKEKRNVQNSSANLENKYDASFLEDLWHESRVQPKNIVAIDQAKYGNGIQKDLQSTIIPQSDNIDNMGERCANSDDLNNSRSELYRSEEEEEEDDNARPSSIEAEKKVVKRIDGKISTQHTAIEGEGLDEEKVDKKILNRGSDDTGLVNGPHARDHSKQPAVSVNLPQHHLTRHWLEEGSRGEVAQQRLGASSLKEAEAMIKNMSQRDLRSAFMRVYGTVTSSYNNNWMRRKLYEAVGSARGGQKRSEKRGTASNIPGPRANEEHDIRNDTNVKHGITTHKGPSKENQRRKRTRIPTVKFEENMYSLPQIPDQNSSRQPTRSLRSEASRRPNPKYTNSGIYQSEVMKEETTHSQETSLEEDAAKVLAGIASSSQW